MSCHIWGDDWPYWSELDRAQEYFYTLYHRCTKKHPITKEKYGTLRFEFEYSWIEDKHDSRIFKESIMRTCKKFPNVVAEICAYAGHVLADDYFEGWCAGVAWQSSKCFWSSKERPNGV